jgi:hypothetical protein
MNYLTNHKWRVFLPIYALSGLVLGLADPLLGRWSQQHGLPPGLVTAASVNIVLPVLAVGLGVAHKRTGIALLGAVGMTVGFVIGLAYVYPPALAWDAAMLFSSIRPVLVMACVGYGVLGTLAAFATRALCR